MVKEMVKQKYLEKAQVLIEALPYIQRFNRKIVVVKDVMRPYMDEDGILTMGIFDFLLDPESLNM